MIMKDVVIFGKDGIYNCAKNEGALSGDINVVGFIDNNPKDDDTLFPYLINKYKYDQVIISMASAKNKFSAINQLIELGVDASKIGVIEEYHINYNYAVDVVEKNNIILRKGDVRLKCCNPLELMIADEVFGGAMYDYFDKHKKIVIDVGMNIGAASLFFANMEDVDSIYGFEIDDYTFSRALENIELNDELIRKKIHAFNCGLGKDDKVERYYKHCGDETASAGMKICLDENDRTSETIEIHVRKASSLLKNIVDDYTGKIVMKIDCEGAEYEILQDLKESGLLSKIDVIFGEWHDNGKRMLLELLQEDNRFSCIIQSQRRSFGLFYAFRNQ